MDSQDEQARLQAAYAEMADRHGSGYHSLDNPAVRWIEDQKRATLVSSLVKANRPDLADVPILEIGCGSGGILPYLIELGAVPANMAGIDLQPGRIAAAKARFPDVRFEVADAARLPFPDASFDIAVTFTVFSSILDSQLRWTVAREIERVLATGGLLLWYDMRWPNPRNPHIRPVSAAELALLFPNFDLAVRPHTLAPPLARLIAGRWPKLANRLARSPLLCSHLMGFLRKR